MFDVGGGGRGGGVEGWGWLRGGGGGVEGGGREGRGYHHLDRAYSATIWLH